MKHKKRIVRILFFVLFGFYSFALISENYSRRNINSILVSVDGEPITLLDVIKATKDKESRIIAIYPSDKIPELIEKARKEAIERLIEDKLLLSEFKRRGYRVPSQMVERMLDIIATELTEGDRRQLEEYARKNNYSIEKIRKEAEERAAIEIMLDEFCSRHLDVSPKEIKEYLDKKKIEEKKAEGKSLELYAIFIKNAEEAQKQEEKNTLIEKICQDLKQNNKSIFMTLARLYSDAASAGKGGYLGWIEADRLRKEFADALQDMKIGTASNAIRTDEGTYFLFLSDLREIQTESEGNNGKVKTANDAREEIIKEKREIARKEFVNKLKEKAIIRYFY